jgi:hypothetical protein
LAFYLHDSITATIDLKDSTVKTIYLKDSVAETIYLKDSVTTTIYLKDSVTATIYLKDIVTTTIYLEDAIVQRDITIYRSPLCLHSRNYNTIQTNLASKVEKSSGKEEGWEESHGNSSHFVG